MKKVILILTAIIILMIAILAAVIINAKNHEKTNKKKVTIAGVDSINEINIEKIGQKIVIVYTENGWEFDDSDQPINQDKVKYMLFSLDKIMLDKKVSQDESEYKKYGVDKENGIKVKLFENEKNVLSLTIGKSVPENMSGYIKEKDNIYIINRTLYEIFNISKKDLYK